MDAAQTENPVFAASVIIAVRDRRDDLERALGSLAEQRVPDGDRFEVIVANDASSDGTAAFLAGLNGQIPGRPDVALRVLANPSRLGPGASRNAAAREACAEVLVFLDSDCVALPGWLQAMLEPLSDPEVGAVGGAEVEDPEEPPLRRAIHFSLTSALTTGRLRGGRGARAGRYMPRTFSMAVRRKAFDRVGGFAAMYHGEDIHLSHRIAAMGHRLVHAPVARVRHRRRSSLPAFARQVFGMGRGRAHLIRFDARLAEPVYLLPPLVLLGLVGVAVGAALLPSWRVPALAVLVCGFAYLVVVGLTAAASLRSPVAAGLAVAVAVVQHVSYAVGMLWGLAAPSTIRRTTRSSAKAR